MRLLCCMVTHNRKNYTETAFAAWFNTCGDSDQLVIVDNASTDDTRDLLDEIASWKDARVIYNDRNLFPGAACNIGWHEGLKRFDATHLMRLDNDVELLPGWREEVERCFDRVPNLGQLGILNRHEDYDGQQPVELDETGTVNVHWDQCGGNCVIPRRFWDEGLRWEAGPWQPGGKDEDSILAAMIRANGYTVGTVVPTIANNMSFHRYHDYPAYYDETAQLRGLEPKLSV